MLSLPGCSNLDTADLFFCTAPTLGDCDHGCFIDWEDDGGITYPGGHTYCETMRDFENDPSNNIVQCPNPSARRFIDDNGIERVVFEC